MDKKSEIAMLRRRGAIKDATASTTAPASPRAGAAAGERRAPRGWWMYHGDPHHTGYVAESDIRSDNVRRGLRTLHTLQLGGPVLSVPAVVDGYVYVGLANDQRASGGNGGSLHKIDIPTGQVVATFRWDLGQASPDAHGFTGMAMTPAVSGGRVYFGAFNGKFYCLDQETLRPVWATDLRFADPDHNQPVTNNADVYDFPAAVMWSSPVVSADGASVYVGCGEGENPELFSFVFCLETTTGDVRWIFCTNQFVEGEPNQPNALPAAVLTPPNLPPGYSVVHDKPVVMGSSVWGSIAYDEALNRLYCPTGNQQPEPNANWQSGEFQPELPSPGYSNGLISLDAGTGVFKGFFQVLPESNYRPSDMDVDVGASPIVFTVDGRKAVGLACKNGGYFVLDAETLELLRWRQLLPYHNDGGRIAHVDRHPPGAQLSPEVTNEESDATPGENFSGAFNTAAFRPGSDGIPARIFVGVGGPNYHSASPGIDADSTPFLRAIDAATLDDAWPLDDGDPRRYRTCRPPMYTNPGESGLSSPAVVNDVVFCSTSKVSLYAFDVRDGTPLWQDDLGVQTYGFNGGYGYCLGPAIWRNYVVAGALVFGRDGGVLKIYGLRTGAEAGR